MKLYSANVRETLIESLCVYCQVVKECCPALLVILVPCQLVMALYRYSVAAIGAENLGNVRFENLVVAALSLTLALVASALVVDRVFLKCTGQRRPSDDGIAAAWGRMMATGWLRVIAEVALFVVAVIAFVIVFRLASTAPLAQVGGSASVLSAILACTMLAPLAAVIVWLFVRWSFAVALSAIHPIMGATAMGESARFVRGRFARCLLVLVAAWLVVSGISAVPGWLASWYSRGVMLGLPAPSGTLLSRIVVLFFGDLFVSFGSLFMPVALTVFWVRTVEPCDLPEGIRRGPARSMVVALLLLGVVSTAVTWSLAGKAALGAREESARQRAAQRASMIRAINEIHKKSAEMNHGGDGRTGRAVE